MNTEIVEKLTGLEEMLKELSADRKKGNQLELLSQKNLLDTSDLTTLFQNDRRTIQRWRDKKILKYCKISGRCYYLWDDIIPLVIGKYKINFN